MLFFSSNNRASSWEEAGNRKNMGSRWTWVSAWTPTTLIVNHWLCLHRNRMQRLALQKWGELPVPWPVPQLFCRPSYSLSSTLGKSYLSHLQTTQWKLPSLLLTTSVLGQRLANYSVQWNLLLGFWKHRWLGPIQSFWYTSSRVSGVGPENLHF